MIAGAEMISIAAAIVAARDGRQADAAQILSDVMKSPHRNRQPMGFVVQALRQVGAAALADWVSDRATSRGLDVTAMVPRFEAKLAVADARTAAAISRRYEHAFAHGAINAAMVGRYTVALSRAGEWDTLAALFPPRATILQIQFESIEGYESLEAFNQSIISQILEAAPRVHLDRSNYLKDTVRYHSLHKIDRPALTTLIALAERAFDRFAAEFAPQPHDPLAQMRPTTRNIAAWANFYVAGSFVKPHLHDRGWLVAVYYPQVATKTIGLLGAGALKVERPDHLGAVAAPGADPIWPDETIAPQPGQLVVMPAYVYHHSVPFIGDGERVAVTIDSEIDRGRGSLPFA